MCEKLYRDDSFELNQKALLVDLVLFSKDVDTDVDKETDIQKYNTLIKTRQESYEKHSIDILEEIKELLVIIGDFNLNKINNPGISVTIRPIIINNIDVLGILNINVELTFNNNYYVKITSIKNK